MWRVAIIPCKQEFPLPTHSNTSSYLSQISFAPAFIINDYQESDLYATKATVCKALLGFLEKEKKKKEMSGQDCHLESSKILVQNFYKTFVHLTNANISILKDIFSFKINLNFIKRSRFVSK